MYDVAIYRKEIQAIGGIETWLINLARRYGKSHKMILLYRDASADLLREIVPHIEVIPYEGQVVRAKKAVFCYDFMGVDTSEAEEKIHVVHADHSQLSFRVNIPKSIDRVVSVSDVARKGLIATEGRDSEVVYNPVDVSNRKRLLRLVSGTRLTSEKGLDRMVALAQALDVRGTLYEWSIFTNKDGISEFSPNVLFRKPTRHLLSHVDRADYLVQLSDTESYGFSIVEALSIGTPVVVTDLPVLSEIGVDKTNSVIVPLKAADYDDIARQIEESHLNFEYEPPKDRWDDLLGEGSGNDYRHVPILVQNIYGADVALMQEDVLLKPGDTTEVFGRSRAEYLVRLGYVQILG